MIRKLFLTLAIFIAVLSVSMVTRMNALPSRLQYRVLEEVEAGTEIGVVTHDLRVSPSPRFKFLSPLPSYLNFNTSTSKLTTAGRIDREAICDTADEDDLGAMQKEERDGKMEEDGVCVLERALVVQLNGRSEVITLTIHIEDINDHQPTFFPNSILFSIIESTPKDTRYKLPQAKDLDTPPFSVSSYLLLTENKKDAETFALEKTDSNKLNLVLIKKLDREKRGFYRMRVVATDAGPPRHSGYLVVEVEVLDANDNSPVFDREIYEVSLSEDAPFMTLVARVQAFDADSGPNSQVFYAFSPSTTQSHKNLFDINNITGEILLLGKLDREETSTYHLKIEAKDKGVGSIPSTGNVVLNVLDINDHAPQISVNTLLKENANEVRLSWHSEVGAFVGHVVGRDLDDGRNGKFNCSIDSGYFHLKPINQEEHHLVTSPFFPKIKTQKNKHQILLNIYCQDDGFPESLSSNKLLLVSLFDSKRNKIEFSKEKYEVSIEENNIVGIPLIRVEVVDYSELSGGNVKRWFELRGGDGKFSVNASTGLVSVEKKLDREENDRYLMQVVAFEKRSNSKSNRIKVLKNSQKTFLSCTASIIIKITDINDNAPTFSASVFSFSVIEEVEKLPQETGTVTAADPDLFPNNQFTFRIALVTARYIQKRFHHSNDKYHIPIKTQQSLPSQHVFQSQFLQPSEYFQIDGNTGKLNLVRKVDREEIEEFNLVIQAIDSSGYYLSSTCRVQVKIEDINDNAPVFIFPNSSFNSLFVYAPISVGDEVGKVEAMDADEGLNAQLSYQLEEHFFKIHPHSGVISLNTPLLENQFNMSFFITIMVFDYGHPKQHNSTILIVSFQPSPHFSSFISRIFYSNRFHNDILPTFVVCSVTLIIIIFLVIAIFKISRQKSFNHVIDSKKQTPSNVTFIPEPKTEFSQREYSHNNISSEEEIESKKNIFTNLFSKFNKKTQSNKILEQKNNNSNRNNFNFYMNNIEKASTFDYSFSNNNNKIAANFLYNTPNNTHQLLKSTTSISSIITNNKTLANSNNNLIKSLQTSTPNDHTLHKEPEDPPDCISKYPTMKLMNNQTNYNSFNSDTNSEKFVSSFKKINNLENNSDYRTLKSNHNFFSKKDDSEHSNLSKISKIIAKKTNNLKLTDERKAVTTIVKNGKLFNEISDT